MARYVGMNEGLYPYWKEKPVALKITAPDSFFVSWEKKLREQSEATNLFAFLGPPEPPLTRVQRLKRTLAYHLYHRWKTLRFGFYRKCECREDW